jgi:hypothetical protein
MSARTAALVIAFDCEAMHRAGGHAPAGFLVAPSDRALVDRMAIAEHEHDGAGDAVLVHVLLQPAVDAREALGRKGAPLGNGGFRPPRHGWRSLAGERSRPENHQRES